MDEISKELSFSRFFKKIGPLLVLGPAIGALANYAASGKFTAANLYSTLGVILFITILMAFIFYTIKYGIPGKGPFYKTVDIISIFSIFTLLSCPWYILYTVNPHFQIPLESRDIQLVIIVFVASLALNVCSHVWILARYLHKIKINYPVICTLRFIVPISIIITSISIIVTAIYVPLFLMKIGATTPH